MVRGLQLAKGDVELVLHRAQHLLLLPYRLVYGGDIDPAPKRPNARAGRLRRVDVHMDLGCSLRPGGCLGLR